MAVARSVVGYPDVIWADEPTGNLDPINTKEIIDLFLEINKLGIVVILTTHHKSVVDLLDCRVVTLQDGKLIRDREHGKFVI